MFGFGYKTIHIFIVYSTTNVVDIQYACQPSLLAGFHCTRQATVDIVPMYSLNNLIHHIAFISLPKRSEHGRMKLTWFD